MVKIYSIWEITAREERGVFGRGESMLRERRDKKRREERGDISTLNKYSD